MSILRDENFILMSMVLMDTWNPFWLKFQKTFRSASEESLHKVQLKGPHVPKANWNSSKWWSKHGLL